MFSQIKLILAGVGTFVLGILLYVFKQRGEEIDSLKEKNESLEQKNKFNKTLDDVNEKIKEGFTEEEKEIEESYNEKEGFVYTATNKPLTPTLLSKLRDSQGLSDTDSESSK